MKHQMRLVSAGVLAVGAAFVHAQAPVQVDGAGALRAMSTMAAQDLAKARKAASRVQVMAGGTAQGIARLCRGEVDIANATRPMRQEEITACGKGEVEFIELPVAFDAVAVIVHPSNTFVKSLTVEELRRAWELTAQGRVTRWNQINARLPDQPLLLLGADRNSEEGSYFNAAILGPGRSPRADYMGSADDAVLAAGVGRSEYALGYVGLAHYLQSLGAVKPVPIAATEGGTPVLPSAQAVASGAYQPLSRLLFVYVSVAALKRAEVRDYAEYLLTSGGRLARAAQHAPLADGSYRRSLERLRKLTKGSAWGGAIPVGITPEALDRKYGT